MNHPLAYLQIRAVSPLGTTIYRHALIGYPLRLTNFEITRLLKVRTRWRE